MKTIESLLIEKICRNLFVAKTDTSKVLCWD